MSYDVIVIGGGPAGCRAAELAATQGLKTILFEKEELGGVCLNRGCIPTKTLLYAARLYARMNYDAAMFGITASHLRLDPAVLWNRKERTVRRLRTALELRLKNAGVEIVNADATLAEGIKNIFKIVASGYCYEGKNVILATGARPKIPKISGIDDALRSGFAVTPGTLLATPEIPASLIILGGGCIGIEFATFYQTIGCKVTIIEQTAALGGGLDDRLTAFLLANLQRRGAACHFNAQAISVGKKCVTLTDGTSIEADRLLLSCGREAAPIPGATDISKSVGVHLAGDVSGQCFLAPVAEWEAEVAVMAILGKSATVDYSMIPRVIFANPEIAFAGQTLAQVQVRDSAAYEKYIPLTLSGRYAIEHPLENGFGISVYSGKGELVGIHLAGTGVSELLALWNPRHSSKPYPHPSLSEIWDELV